MLYSNRLNSISKTIISILVASLIFIVISGSAANKENAKPQPNTEKALLVNNVHLAAQGLGAVLIDMDIDRQMELCRNFVQPIRFFDDKSGYFYIYDMDGVNIAHATQPEKQGMDLIDYKDSRGNLLIQGLIKAAKEGGGFVDFWWENPLTKKEEKKLGYAEPIPGTNFFIGSGIYVGE